MPESKERSISILLMSALLLLLLCTLLKLLGIGSLWLDETITFWIVKDRFNDALGRALQFQGQSPFYYGLAWIFHKYSAGGALDLRIFSVIISLGTLALFWLFAANFLRGSAVIFAMLVLLSTDAFQVAMISARPYALALFFCLASCLTLFNWQKQATAFRFLMYVTCAALTFYAHYLFGLIFGVHLLQVYFSSHPSMRARNTEQVLFALCLVGAVCLPALTHLRSLAARADLLQFTAASGLSGFFSQWLPLDLLVCLLSALLCAWAVFGIRVSKPAYEISLSTIAIGFIAPAFLIPSLYFVFGVSLFHERYFLWYLPFLAIAAGLLFSCLKSEQAKFAFAAIFSVLILVRAIDKTWQIEDWQGASLALTEQRVNQDDLLLVNSGLVELRQISNYGQKDFQEYLLAPFAAYPNPAQKLLIPFSFEDGESRQYFEDKIKSQIADRPEFYLICLGQQKISLSDAEYKPLLLKHYYQNKFSDLGYSFKDLGSFGQVSLLKFEKQEK